MFAGSLFPGNGMAYLSEVPALLEHYNYHLSNETPGISFVDFLALHYGNRGHEKSDQTHHSKLPLRHQVNSVTADKISLSCALEIENTALYDGRSFYPFIRNDFVVSEAGLGIFHPPRS